MKKLFYLFTLLFLPLYCFSAMPVQTQEYKGNLEMSQTIVTTSHTATLLFSTSTPIIDFLIKNKGYDCYIATHSVVTSSSCARYLFENSEKISPEGMINLMGASRGIWGCLLEAQTADTIIYWWIIK